MRRGDTKRIQLNSDFVAKRFPGKKTFSFQESRKEVHRVRFCSQKRTKAVKQSMKTRHVQPTRGDLLPQSTLLCTTYLEGKNNIVRHPKPTSTNLNTMHGEYFDKSINVDKSLTTLNTELGKQRKNLLRLRRLNGMDACIDEKDETQGIGAMICNNLSISTKHKLCNMWWQ